MKGDDLRVRTKEFAKRVIKVCRSLPNNREGWRIGDQLFRCGTSTASNYRAACRGRSKAEFISKLGTVLEEADESLFWMEMLCECGIVKAKLLQNLMDENRQLIAIFVSSLKTAKSD